MSDRVPLRPAALAAILIAGRRAAFGELHVIAKNRGLVVAGDTEEEYAGDGRIGINGVDLRPMVDAAVLETIVRLAHPDQPVPARRRRWWQLWR